jgi:hypothetical protein
MSYATISTIAQDPDVAARVRGCLASEVIASQYMSVSKLRDQLDLSAKMWLLAASPDWAPAWEYASATTRAEGAPTIGNDPAVITDGMILSAVQALRP